MTLSKGARIYKFKALTDLWTGSITDINGRITGKPVSDRLITTGLLGSIRWWFEVVVRGLGGHACDPSNGEGRCPDKAGNHCAVCELFGCTGWARKFRFGVLDKDGNIRTSQIKQGEPANPSTFSLRFTPLRPIDPEEWALLDATLRLIDEYGAIGGKTVFKPTDETHRIREAHHQDYGIVKVVNVDPPTTTNIDSTDLKKYVRDERWRKPESDVKDADFTWASLNNFWFVEGKTLSRENESKSSFNKVLGRKDSKACRDCGAIHNPPNKCPKTNRYPMRESEQLDNSRDEISGWLAGSSGAQQESKKVFSFKKPARTFGFVKPGLIDFNAMKQRLANAWGQSDWDFLTGDKIINQLFVGKEGHP